MCEKKANESIWCNLCWIRNCKAGLWTAEGVTVWRGWQKAGKVGLSGWVAIKSLLIFRQVNTNIWVAIF